MKFFVLMWRGRGWEDSPIHYLYKSVSKKRHPLDGYNYKITPDIGYARQWKTREGAEGYADRFAGTFILLEVSDI
jgi:hypothetical protein